MDACKVNTYSGFDAFLKKLGGYDEIDKIGKLDAMKIAFVGGQAYQAKCDAEALRKLNVAALRRQA